MSEALKRCPFCGGELGQSQWPNILVHPKIGCVLDGNHFTDSPAIIAKWNTRANDCAELVEVQMTQEEFDRHLARARVQALEEVREWVEELSADFQARIDAALKHKEPATRQKEGKD